MIGGKNIHENLGFEEKKLEGGTTETGQHQWGCERRGDCCTQPDCKVQEGLG